MFVRSMGARGLSFNTGYVACYVGVLCCVLCHVASRVELPFLCVVPMCCSCCVLLVFVFCLLVVYVGVCSVTLVFVLCFDDVFLLPFVLLETFPFVYIYWQPYKQTPYSRARTIHSAFMKRPIFFHSRGGIIAPYILLP